MRRRPVYSLAIIFGLTAATLLILLSGPTSLFIRVGGKTRIINIGIIVDVDSRETTLVREFVEGLPYTNSLYFVIEEWDSLKNKDFVQFMKDRGEIIPAFSYLQTYEPEDRKRYVDHFLGEFKRFIGYYPKGIFTFQPDTYTANYLRDKYNISYIIGYAFDQYLVDYMSMRGGWQAPYYGSRENVIVPSRTGGVVILPHLTWDWIARYTLDHRCNTHPENSYQVFEKDSMKALEYMKVLIGQTLDRLEPFGYAMVGFEFKNMGLRAGILGMVREYYSWIIEWSGAEIMTPSQTVEWFTTKFAGTPEYRIRFRSPATGEEVEWFFNPYYRLARSGWFVKSFLDYAEQKPDPYLNKGGFVNFYQKPTATNQIDTSLTFKIDALDQKGDYSKMGHVGVMYLGPLPLFPLLYSIHPVYVAALAGLCAITILMTIRVSRHGGILSRKAAASFSATILLLAPTLQLGVILLQKPAPAEEVVKDDWLRWAEVAWRYFQPGVGVVRESGLHMARIGWARFTDWDLGTYLMAVLNAEALGILPTSGEWGADYRIGKILDFLKSRPLTADKIPYLLYSSDTGLPVIDRETNPSDSGRLLAALHLLVERKPHLRKEVEEIVFMRTNYKGIATREDMWRQTSGPYAYVDAYGFRLWGFDSQYIRRAQLELRRLMEGEKIETYGVKLPRGFITMEPVIIGLIELGLDGELSDLARDLYIVQEKRYMETGKLTAWSEGATDGVNTDKYYVFQWIVMRDRTWVITDGSLQEVEAPPISYAKVAFALHALYKTSYTDRLVKTMSQLETQRGFLEGLTEDGRPLTGPLGLSPAITDKTNSMIISVAKYVLDKHPFTAASK